MITIISRTLMEIDKDRCGGNLLQQAEVGS